jgi:glutathione S-transferase
LQKSIAGWPGVLGRSGKKYSVCDPYLLVFWIWNQRDDVIEHVEEMPNWRGLADRIFARPATQRVLAREGLTPEALRSA